MSKTEKSRYDVHAEKLVKEYNEALAVHGKDGKCPYTGQESSSAPFSVLLALDRATKILVVAGEYSEASMKSVAIRLLELTCGGVTGSFKVGPSISGAVKFWTKGLMQVAHGFKFTEAGVERIGVHPYFAATGTGGKGKVYHPSQHDLKTKVGSEKLIGELRKPKNMKVKYGKAV
jgi:hypothetical protein